MKTTLEGYTDWHARAAAALDRTHAVGERGPRTFAARRVAAEYLDGRPVQRSEFLRSVRWLESVALLVKP